MIVGQAAAISILVFVSAILKDRAIDLLIVTVNRVVNYDAMFAILAERILLQVIQHSNKYSFQNFKNPEYCNIFKCLDIIISASTDLKAISDHSEILILGNVVTLCHQGDVSGATAEASKINLSTISNEETLITLSHHVCIALLNEGSTDSAIEYFTTTVLKMSLRRKSQSQS